MRKVDIEEWSQQEFQEYINKAEQALGYSRDTLFTLFQGTGCSIVLFVLAVDDMKNGCSYTDVFNIYSKRILLQ